VRKCGLRHAAPSLTWNFTQTPEFTGIVRSDLANIWDDLAVDHGLWQAEFIEHAEHDRKV
jgi:hypothetical protein